MCNDSVKTARFTLHAQGGFVVSSEIKSGNIAWIVIKSLYGNTCGLELPWNKTSLQSNLNRKSRLVSERITAIETKPDEVMVLVPQGQDLQTWSVVAEKPSANENVKYHSSGKTQLGIPRMF